MSIQQFMANLTWPFRGRRVTQESEKRIWDELKALRWEELQKLRQEVQDALAEMKELRFERARAEGYLKGEVAALSRQLDVGLAASEKLARANFSSVLDRMEKRQN